MARYTIEMGTSSYADLETTWEGAAPTSDDLLAVITEWMKKKTRMRPNRLSLQTLTGIPGLQTYKLIRCGRRSDWVVYVTRIDEI